MLLIWTEDRISYDVNGTSDDVVAGISGKIREAHDNLKVGLMLI